MTNTIETNTLRDWLESHQPLTVLSSSSPGHQPPASSTLRHTSTSRPGWTSFPLRQQPRQAGVKLCMLEEHQAAPAVRSTSTAPTASNAGTPRNLFSSRRAVAPRASAPQRDSVQIACDRDLGVRVHAGFWAESDVAIREHLDSTRGREICLRLEAFGRGDG